MRRTARNCLLPDWRLRPAGFVSRPTPLRGGDWWRPGRRAKAVQDLLNHARRVKDACVRAQAAHCTPNAQAAVQAVDDAKTTLLQQAFFHDVWISEHRGVPSIRDFNSAINGNQMQAMASRQAVEAALAQPFDQLRKALKEDLGFQPR